jgi:NAD(P)-dependent dehydrogenase (short-subunit alcohol dehydrogenase family)
MARSTLVNAGITRDRMFLKMTPEDWHAVIDTNLNSMFNDEAGRPAWSRRAGADHPDQLVNARRARPARPTTRRQGRHARLHDGAGVKRPAGVTVNTGARATSAPT